jgi:glycosyltransferase involved in cell wall biosynthesis
MKISATVLAVNEIKTLPLALESLKSLANEIVLVIDPKTDELTKQISEIGKKYGAKIYFRKLDNFASQNNFAMEKATGDWILSLDADEIISSDLADEIKSIVMSHKSSVVAYSMPRKNIILGKYIKHTRWSTELDRHVWLWKKGYGKKVGDVHEEVVVDGKVGRLENAKIHYQYETVAEFVDMINRYSELEAGQIVQKGGKFSYFHLLWDPVYMFLVRYFYRLGFLDGQHGFVLSYLMAIYEFAKWVKVWKKKR